MIMIDNDKICDSRWTKHFSHINLFNPQQIYVKELHIMYITIPIIQIRKLKYNVILRRWQGNKHLDSINIEHLICAKLCTGAEMQSTMGIYDISHMGE